MEPPQKRHRTAKCPCLLCDGRERDYRNVESHLRTIYEPTIIDSIEQPSASSLNLDADNEDHRTEEECSHQLSNVCTASEPLSVKSINA